MSAESLNKTLLAGREITKVYGSKTVLDKVSIDVNTDDFLLIRGISGSGKSTLMNCLSGIDRPDEGEVIYTEDKDIYSLKDDELTEWRARNVGLVFQAPNLLNGLSIRKNITTVHGVEGVKLDPDWLLKVTDVLGVTELLREDDEQGFMRSLISRRFSNAQRVNTLSGGQQQRVSIARALAHQPDVVFADEPTAALDRESGRRVYGLLGRVVKETGVSVVVIAHDDIAPDYADRVVELADGRIT